MLKAWIESSTPSSSVLTWNGKTAPLSYLHKQLDITGFLPDPYSPGRSQVQFISGFHGESGIPGVNIPHRRRPELGRSMLIGHNLPPQGGVAHFLSPILAKGD